MMHVITIEPPEPKDTLVSIGSFDDEKIFDGCVGIIRGYRFITVMPNMWAVNKPRKAITRKAARKMRRKWHV